MGFAQAVGSMPHGCRARVAAAVRSAAFGDYAHGRGRRADSGDYEFRGAYLAADAAALHSDFDERQTTMDGDGVRRRGFLARYGDAARVGACSASWGRDAGAVPAARAADA